MVQRMLVVSFVNAAASVHIPNMLQARVFLFCTNSAGYISPPQCWLHSIVFKSTPSCTSSHSGLSSRRKVTRSLTALST